MFRFVAALAAVSLSLVAAPARADQVTVVDVTYEHSAETTFDSHLIVDASPDTPRNLRSPVDYASGSTVVRLEVFTKPSDVPTRFQVCFNASPTYACTDQSPPYTTTGVYTWETPFSRFWQGDAVDWSRGLGRTVSLILKDTRNRKPAPENVGRETAALYMPTLLRVTVTLVSPGATYVPPEDTIDAGAPELDAGLAPSDAGSPQDDADAGAPMRDAGGRGPGPRPEPDAGVRMPPEPVRGGCSAANGASSGASLLLAVAVAFFVRRRPRRR